MPAEKDRTIPEVSKERVAELRTNQKAAMTAAHWSARTGQPADVLPDMLAILGLDGEPDQPSDGPDAVDLA